jgi:hypothetical protein
MRDVVSSSIRTRSIVADERLSAPCLVVLNRTTDPFANFTTGFFPRNPRSSVNETDGSSSSFGTSSQNFFWMATDCDQLAQMIQASFGPLETGRKGCVPERT